MYLIRTVKKSQLIGFAALVFFIVAMSVLLAALSDDGLPAISETPDPPDFESIIDSLLRCATPACCRAISSRLRKYS